MGRGCQDVSFQGGREMFRLIIHADWETSWMSRMMLSDTALGWRAKEGATLGCQCVCWKTVGAPRQREYLHKLSKFPDSFLLLLNIDFSSFCMVCRNVLLGCGRLDPKIHKACPSCKPEPLGCARASSFTWQSQSQGKNQFGLASEIKPTFVSQFPCFKVPRGCEGALVLALVPQLAKPELI